MEIKQIREIRKLAIKAIVSDDYLMQKLVLKGGNAIDIIYEAISSRASMDLDFSMEDDFGADEISEIEKRIARIFTDTFGAENYVIFDIKFMRRPSEIDSELANFWGGYRIEFKVTGRREFEKDKNNFEMLRRRATVVGEHQRKTFQVDISKFEYCAPKREAQIDGYTLYVYTPQMIICEKLRAICQQMPEYLKIVKKFRTSPRARDFFDIYQLAKNCSIVIESSDMIELLQKIFAAKKVPVDLLAHIEQYKEYHRQNFIAVTSTVHPEVTVDSFDIYFDFVVEKARLTLEAFRKI